MKMTKRDVKNDLLHLIENGCLSDYEVLEKSNDLLEFLYKEHRYYYDIADKLIETYENFRDLDFNYSPTEIREMLTEIASNAPKNCKITLTQEPFNFKLNGVSFLDYGFIDEVEKL